MREELRNDYKNFVMNNSRKKEEELNQKYLSFPFPLPKCFLRKGDKEVLGEMEQRKQKDKEKIKEMKQRQLEQKDQYKHGLIAQVEEGRSQKVLAQEKEKEETRAVKPLFTPHYKKPQDNIKDILNHQLNEKETKREQERTQKEKEREQMNQNYNDYQRKVKDVHNHKYSQKHDLKLQVSADLTDKITEKQVNILNKMCHVLKVFIVKNSEG